MHLRRALIDGGCNDRALKRLVDAGDLAKPRRGAYVDGPTYAGLDPLGKYAVLGRAVLAQGCAAASLSHGSALPWFGGPDYGIDLRTVDITRHDRRAGRAEARVRQHAGLLLPGDVLTVAGVSVIHPARAVLEFSTQTSLEVAVVQASMLLHSKAMTAAELETFRLRMDRWPGSLKADLVCRLAEALLESVGEARFWTFCYRHSIPRPVPQYVLRDVDGLVVARLDFAWPALGKWIEFDGKIKYTKLLRAGESASDVVVREKEREKTVRRITGWDCERIVNDDLVRPNQLERLIRTFLGASAGAPWTDLPGAA